ncbi:MAG: YlmC/YmxH family sporulation protein [Bacteroides sp.]|nr:YlmC/YmxH family sporulation protein [Bacillota bacterium]MCM1393934.1 YlmC/YmxH family sporulation protein [[Eubacterium] siraeum]MCM1455899.1 YlmC/YmxH family sporulation protein [Bacteroides sp.]
MNRKQYSFTEMSRKDVINVADGRELGHVCDMVFNNCGGIIGFVVPGKKSFFKSITSSENVFIPWNKIIKIGSDVILVELVGNARACSVQDQPLQATAYDVSETSDPLYASAYPSDSYDQSRYACPAYSDAGAQTVYHTQDGSHTV